MKEEFIEHAGRFRGASDAIDLEKLEKETQKIMYLGLMVAVSFHAALVSYFMFKQTEVQVVKPPSMELVIRRPRMTKAFEFKKQRAQQREYQKKEVVERRPTAEIKTKQAETTMMGTIATYNFGEMNIETGADLVVTESIDIEMTAAREPEKQISMKEEMISLDDLDTGQYKAMIIQDPSDKQSVKGFIYIATLWGSLFEPGYKRAIIHLQDSVNRYTNINAKVDQHLFIDSSRIFDTPFVYLCLDDQAELTEIEARNFGAYLRQGGFAVFDNGNPREEFSDAEASLRQFLKDALGADAKFLPIPNTHPLYHSFFDFDDGPPQGYEVGGSGNSMSKQVLFLEGITIEGRLVAIYSDKGYGIKWNDDTNNEPQLKIGVNFVVFALTQEGSIAQQKMDFFSAVQ